MKLLKKKLSRKKGSIKQTRNVYEPQIKSQPARLVKTKTALSKI